jgi:ubiquinone/menaquinone biosynthesis C-methylase UbiE
MSVDREDRASSDYRQKRIAHWDDVARQLDHWTGWGGAYHRRLESVYQFLVSPGQRVIEIGCGTGDLLAALNPSVGVGVDFSGEMVRRAAERYPGLRFIQADAHALDLKEKCDVIILSDLVNDLWDVQRVLEEIRCLSASQTRIVLNFYSHLWELPLNLAKHLKLAKPTLYQNWLTVEDMSNLMGLAGFDVIRHWEEMLWPFSTPVLATLLNRFLAKTWPFRHLALAHFMVGRPAPSDSQRIQDLKVSVIIPARNEAGNIAEIFKRTPEMGSGTELVFVEGHSNDNTYQVIERAIVEHPERQCTLFQQSGTGKGDAVRLGFAQASGDILMILDADLTVPPEDLPRFYEVIRSGKGEFVNGVRLVYPMEKEAMRFFNLLGNKFFSLAFSWLLEQRIKDTLCGTKVLRKDHYNMIVANRAYFGDFDPFGDFDLLFGAAKLNLKIVEMPIRYRERSYGATNISRWKHGWLLLKMVLFASRRIKFV